MESRTVEPIRLLPDDRAVPVRRRFVYRQSESLPLYAIEVRDEGTYVIAADSAKGRVEIPEDGALAVPVAKWAASNPANPVLYRGSELTDSRRSGHAGYVHLVEGEAAVDALRAEGGIAVTVAGGLGLWLQAYARALRGMDVVVTIVRDEPSSVVTSVVESLSGQARSVRVLRLECSVEAFFAAGRTLADLDRSVLTAETAGGAGDWPTPAKLEASPVPEFPVAALPTYVREMVEVVSYEMQVPPDFPAMWALGTLAAAAGGLVEVATPTGYAQPVALWVMVLGEPGTRKSSAHAAATAPLAALADCLSGLTEGARREAHAQQTYAQAQLAVAEKALRAVAGSDDAVEVDRAKKVFAEALTLAEDAVVPSRPDLTVSDGTPEAIAYGLWQQGGRLTVSSSEPGVLQQMAGLYSRDANLDVFLQGFSGDPISVRRGGFSSHRDRTEPPSATVRRPALSIVCGAQPGVIRAISRDGMLVKRGAADRFCMVEPDDIVGTRQVWPSGVHRQARDLWAAQVVLLGSRLHSAICERLPSGEPVSRPVLTLEPLAAAEMKVWLEDKERRLGDRGDLRPIRGWASKIDAFALRIAALLHLATHADEPLAEPAITEDAVRASLAICDYLIAHTKRVWEAQGDARLVDDGRTILEWIRRTGKTTFDRREAYTAIGRFRKEADRIDAPLSLLVRTGSLREHEITNARMNRGFVVNPLVHHPDL